MEKFKKYLREYGEYLEEIRKKLYRLVIIFAISFIVGFFMTSPAIRFMMENINIENITIVTTSPFQLIDLAMSIGFFFACIVTIPIFIWGFYSFLKSGLLKKERRIFIFSLPLALLLFLIGFLYGSATLYYAIKFVAQINVGLGVVNYWDISLFFSQVVFTASLLGLLFIFPLIMTFLIRLGVASTQFLKSKRRHAIAVIFIFVSLLPPTDGISLILMALPLIVIFELTILFNRRNSRTRQLVV